MGHYMHSIVGRLIAYSKERLLGHFGHSHAATIGGAGVVGATGGNQGEHHDGEEG